jgi:hypothetical protein
VSPDDMQRFEIERGPRRRGGVVVILRCTRCAWEFETLEPITLAELVQRAEEHTEVCR